MNSKVLLQIVLGGLLSRQFVQLKLPGTFESLLTTILNVGIDLIRDPTESRMEFWFFASLASRSYSQDLLDRLIATEPFAGHTKILRDECSATGRSFGRPALVIAFFGANELLSEESPLFAQFLGINDQTKLIVLFPFDSKDYLQPILKFFKNAGLVNIFYVAISTESYDHAAFNYMVISDKIQVVHKYQSKRQVFPEQYDIEGKLVNTCAGHAAFYSELDLASGLSTGFDVQLVSFVIHRMNANLQIHYDVCDSKDKSCRVKHFEQKMCNFHFGRWNLKDAEHGVPVLPMQETIIVVPRGTPLNVFELLRAPYSAVAWKVVITISIIGLILVQLIWKHSAVNLLLLVVCELGESILQQTKPTEQLVIVGFEMFVFLLLSAYEAKIVSFLADWPYNPDIASVEELQPAGIKLLSNFIPETFFDDPRLRSLIEITNISLLEDVFKIPQNTGFLSLYEVARVILRKQLNVDRRTGRAHFVMLEERLSSDLAFFSFGYRNPLRVRFADLLQRTYESGFDRYWFRTIAAQQSFEPVIDEPPKMIQFEQLQHLTMVFVSLWSCCLVVFLLELVFHWSEKIADKIRKDEQ